MLGESRLDNLDADFAESVRLFTARLLAEGVEVAIVAGRRTMAAQNDLYQQGRGKPGAVVTNAKGGSSPHNFGMAVDLCPVQNGNLWWNAPDDLWRRMADMGKEMGLIPGYYFKSLHDPPHYEAPDWRQTQLAWKRGEIEIA